MRAVLLISLSVAAAAVAPSWLSGFGEALPTLSLKGSGERSATSLFETPAPELKREEHSTRLSAEGTLAKTLSAPTQPAEDLAKGCGEGMVLVEGQYCPDVEHHCKRWMDPEGPYRYFRCAEYQQPARCKTNTVTLRYCIDRDEHTAEGERLPENNKSLTDAARTCAAEGKRVCRESEWNFACEGEEMRPYPYGFTRDATACNADHTDLVNDAGKLKDLRAPSDAYPRCESPFGVRNLTGNLEEMVARDGKGPMQPAMKGAYWQPSRNHCRAAQTAHDAFYHGTETGFRCCADAPGAESK